MFFARAPSVSANLWGLQYLLLIGIAERRVQGGRRADGGGAAGAGRETGRPGKITINYCFSHFLLCVPIIFLSCFVL